MWIKIRRILFIKCTFLSWTQRVNDFLAFIYLLHYGYLFIFVSLDMLSAIFPTISDFVFVRHFLLWMYFNTLRPRQNGRHIAGDIFKCIFMNENAWISLKISLKFVPKFRINNIPALVQIMTWHWPGDKPLSEPMMFSLLTHICVTRPQWVKLMFFKWYLLIP